MNTQTSSAGINSDSTLPGSMRPIAYAAICMSHIAKSWDSFTGQGYNQVIFFQERKAAYLTHYGF